MGHWHIAKVGGTHPRQGMQTFSTHWWQHVQIAHKCNALSSTEFFSSCKWVCTHLLCTTMHLTGKVVKLTALQHLVKENEVSAGASSTSSRAAAYAPTGVAAAPHPRQPPRGRRRPTVPWRDAGGAGGSGVSYGGQDVGGLRARRTSTSIGTSVHVASSSNQIFKWSCGVSG